MQRLSPILLVTLLLAGCDSADGSDAEARAGVSVVGAGTYLLDSPTGPGGTPAAATLEDVDGFDTQLLSFNLFQGPTAERDEELRLQIGLEVEPDVLANGEAFDVLAVVAETGTDRNRDGAPSLIALFRACPPDAVGFECVQNPVAPGLVTLSGQGEAEVEITTLTAERVAGSVYWPGFNVAGGRALVSVTFSLPIE